MSGFDNTNSGAIFKNDKITSDRSPQSRGSAECKCPHCGIVTKFWISAWTKISKGKKERFLSLAFTPDDADVNKGANKPTTQGAPDLDENWDDDIPF